MGRAALACALAAIVLVGLGAAQAAHVDETGLERAIGQDLIPAVTEPAFDDEPYVGNFDLVVGLVDAATGRATAYPLKVLAWHEIVNDVLGDTPIAVTYCPLCRTGIVFDRPVGVDGEPLVFLVSGYLYRNNLVMYDVQTFSLWPQILGEAISGTWHGAELRVRSATTETWLEWSARHPDTRVLARPFPEICFDDGTCIEGIDYDVDPYDGYYASEGTLRDRIHTDRRLHPKALVVGVAAEGVAVAYPFSELEPARVVNDVVAGRRVVVTFHNGTAQAFLRGDRAFALGPDRSIVDRRGGSFDLVTGEGAGDALERFPSLVAFWFAWKDHHPGTYVHGIDWPPNPPNEPALPLAVVGTLVVAAAAVAVVRAPRRTRAPEAEAGGGSVGPREGEG